MEDYVYIVSEEIEALLDFYHGRKLISVKDIISFSDTYRKMKEYKEEFSVIEFQD